MHNDASAARTALGLEQQGHIVGLLPGSRRGEVASLMPLLLSTARLMYQALPSLKFVIPAINAEREAELMP